MSDIRHSLLRRDALSAAKEVLYHLDIYFSSQLQSAPLPPLVDKGPAELLEEFLFQVPKERGVPPKVGPGCFNPPLRVARCRAGCPLCVCMGGVLGAVGVGMFWVPPWGGWGCVVGPGGWVCNPALGPPHPFPQSGSPSSKSPRCISCLCSRFLSEAELAAGTPAPRDHVQLFPRADQGLGSAAHILVSLQPSREQSG